jgi:inner membrane protein
MDPVAHTLFGATLAEAGLKRKTAYATATLVIGANLPDLDIIAAFAGSDTSLYVRRGWSHGVLALIIWPFLLTAIMLIWHKWKTGLHFWCGKSGIVPDRESTGGRIGQN